MSNRRSVFAALTLCVVAGHASATNLLNNAGFENPLGFDFADSSNWNGFFGGPAGTFLQAFNDTGATPRSGSNALVTTIRGVAGVTDGMNAFTGHVQIVTGIVPGQEYELAVWARTNPLLLNGAEMRVEWQDAGGGEIARFNLPLQGLLTNEYQRISFTDFAPAGTARAAVVLAVQSFVGTSPADTSVAWDDASLTVIPAPGAMALVGLAGLAGLRRRR
jgi:MYXO-CTERM domain-containing protein